MKKPSDFCTFPSDSIVNKREAEQVAVNIMVILKRRGDSWSILTWKKYKEERKKDGNFTESERGHFYQVKDYCVSSESACKFSPVWRKVS